MKDEMKNINEEKQFKIIKSRGLANCISYIMQRNYYTYKSVESDNREVYSFVTDEKFEKLYTEIMKLCKEFRD